MSFDYQLIGRVHNVSHWLCLVDLEYSIQLSGHVAVVMGLGLSLRLELVGQVEFHLLH